MTRRARTVSATGYYHVMMRGNNREYIFQNELQKRWFMEALKMEIDAGRLRVAAWCLMDNHVHLLVKAEPEELTLGFRKINVRFAMWLNSSNSRVGHVFQDRFKSECIETDSYLLAVLRYVHNNPVKAKMVPQAGAYAWSSYQEYLNDSVLVGEEQKQLVMDYFNRSSEQYEAFHQVRDDAEYLEIKEDLERYRLERAQEILSSFCAAQGIHTAGEIARRPALMDELIGELLDQSRLSHRKIAELIGVSGSRVHQSASK